MTLEELKKDLRSKLKVSIINRPFIAYFKTKLFKKDEQIYKRRSFNDLFIYYRRYKVSEKLLMKALIESHFSAYYCPDIKKIVFFMYDGNYKFTSYTESDFLHYKTKYNNTNKWHNCGKYTFEYLEKLYDSIK